MKGVSQDLPSQHRDPSHQAWLDPKDSREITVHPDLLDLQGLPDHQDPKENLVFLVDLDVQA